MAIIRQTENKGWSVSRITGCAACLREGVQHTSSPCGRAYGAERLRPRAGPCAGYKKPDFTDWFPRIASYPYLGVSNEPPYRNGDLCCTVLAFAWNSYALRSVKVR